MSILTSIRFALASFFRRMLGHRPVETENDNPRIGILVIGSLLWRTDGGGVRDQWRTTRLNLEEKVPVRARIRYGRRSKTKTFTMTLERGSDDCASRAIVVPCKSKKCDIDALVQEAQALWAAEDNTPTTEGQIAAQWGCVGALFRDKERIANLVREWSEFFRWKVATPVGVVSRDGILEIPWPQSVNGPVLDLDVILATSTKPDEMPPTAGQIADAWREHGSEDYFFQNVRNGIRTDEDGLIWKQIERIPSWLNECEKKYPNAVKILKAEAEGRPSTQID